MHLDATHALRFIRASTETPLDRDQARTMTRVWFAEPTVRRGDEAGLFARWSNRDGARLRADAGAGSPLAKSLLREGVSAALSQGVVFATYVQGSLYDVTRVLGRLGTTTPMSEGDREVVDSLRAQLDLVASRCAHYLEFIDSCDPSLATDPHVVEAKDELVRWSNTVGHYATLLRDATPLSETERSALLGVVVASPGFADRLQKFLTYLAEQTRAHSNLEHNAESFSDKLA